jgi:hypothetical protein
MSGRRAVRVELPVATIAKVLAAIVLVWLWLRLWQ